MIQIRAVDAAYEIRAIPFDFVEVGSAYDVDLDVVADQEHDAGYLSAGVAGWIFVSPDAGANFYPVPEETISGYDLGAFVAGEKKRIRIRLLIPAGTELRKKSISLKTTPGV